MPGCRVEAVCPGSRGASLAFRESRDSTRNIGISLFGSESSRLVRRLFSAQSSGICVSQRAAVSRSDDHSLSVKVGDAKHSLRAGAYRGAGPGAQLGAAIGPKQERHATEGHDAAH